MVFKYHKTNNLIKFLVKDNEVGWVKLTIKTIKAGLLIQYK